MDLQLQQILKKAGLVDEPTKTLEALSNLSINEEMDAVGLTNQTLFNSIADILSGDTSNHAKLRAIELSLRVKKIMSENPTQMAPIQIIINDSNPPAGINPILIPRELSNEKND